ncbi:MAG: LytR C-terminal domain-containing protein [bacterium]
MIEPLGEDIVMQGASKQWQGGITVLTIFLILVIGVAWGYYQSQITNSLPADATHQALQAGQISPEPSMAPTIETKPVFSVLNASGVAGAAGKLAEIIKQEGYEVGETGNATTQTGTTISYKTSERSQGEAASWLQDHYPEAEVKIESELITDIKVVIGK